MTFGGNFVKTKLFFSSTYSARPGNVILKLNSLVKKIENGAELFASKKIGFVTAIQTVLMGLTRTRPKFLIVTSPLRIVHQISSSK